ncbi:MAG: ArnT family glycosyltransferase [Nitrososphaerales archaeon]
MLPRNSLEQKSRFSRIELVILAGILIGAVILRFWDLTSIGLRGDEAVYAGQALILSGDQEMNRFFILASRGTSNFLFHQGMQAIVYALAGFSDFTTRFLPAMFSVLTVGVVFLLGRELFGRWTGLLAAFLLAINGYAVSLGRLALLDSTMTFFFALSMLFLAKWMNTGKSEWIYFLAASTGIAIMSKVPAFIIIPIAVLTIVSTGRLKNLNSRALLLSVLIFAAFISPAILQIMSDREVFTEFLSEGTSRVSDIKMTYYLEVLIQYAGYFFIALTVLGIAVALLHRKKEDLLCLIGIAVVAGFFLIYPLRGWNYILPLVPAAAILGARALVHLIAFLKPMFSARREEKLRNLKVVVGAAGILLLITASYYQGYASVYNMVYDRPFVGLREAAYWLRDNAPPGAGVMTISHGSAQYVLSLYAKIDSYPFGAFRLHTVLPGGKTIPGAPPPEPLIQNGTVTYLVHYIARGGDDPIHIPIKTPVEESFTELIQKYQSHTRYVFYDELVGLDGSETEEARLWIYEVGKRLPEPQLQVKQENDLVHLAGSGFLIDSYVSIYYGDALLSKSPTDKKGTFNASIGIPNDFVKGEQLIVFDEGDNRVSVSLEQALTTEEEVIDGSG